MVVFFKQKTAYEMRISDWSSDVCSSDLGGSPTGAIKRRSTPACAASPSVWRSTNTPKLGRVASGHRVARVSRSEERRVGKQGVSTCRSRWSQSHYNRNTNTTRTQIHDTKTEHILPISNRKPDKV